MVLDMGQTAGTRPVDGADRRRARPGRRAVAAGVAGATLLLALVGGLLVAMRWTGNEDRGGEADIEHVAAYIAPWDEEEGLRSLRARSGSVLTSLSPVWYTPTDDGRIVRNVSSPEEPVVAEARANGLALIPSVSNYRDDMWDTALVTALVSTPEARSRHVGHIVETVVGRGWDGIDIDYENLARGDRDAFSAFVAQLGRALDGEGKTLTVTVHAKTVDDPGTDFHYAQDYAAIGRAADFVRVMAYDYSWSGSPPGPVAPPSWLDDVLTFATSQMPVEKIQVGLATYGYDWVGRNGTSVSWRDATSLAAAEDRTVAWDPDDASAGFTYRDDEGRRRTVAFEDSRSVAAKIAVAQRHGITAVFFWKLGGEDPGVWAAVPGGR
jgi:spore germination protein